MDQLKLSSQEFPFTLSLQPLVMTEFGRQVPGGERMSREELFGYLSTIEDFEAGPLQAVQTQTEIVGEPAVPAPEDHAALAWVGAAFDHWEQAFPLEPAVAEKVRRIKPVLAVIALADEQFYVPGLHPMHQALDALYDAAVGWQQDLGRAGEPLLKLVEQAVDGPTACLAENGTGLMDQLRSATKAAKRFESRTRRMAQRTADIERGQLRAIRARESAAAMINAQTARHPIPGDIGKFIVGPWFESVQLVLLKYTEKSPQWQEVCDATADLMTVLTPEESDSPGLEAGSQVIENIKKWLLSLQHDEQLTSEVISEVEFTCLRMLKGAELDRTTTGPLPVGDAVPQNDHDGDLTALEVGDWFQIELRKGGDERMQLAMNQSDEQRLLFCNQAGAKPRTMDYARFSRLMEEGKIHRLDTGASFSRSLAAVVGIDSLQALAELTGRPLPNSEPVAPKNSDGQPAADLANFQTPPQPVKKAKPEPPPEQTAAPAAAPVRTESRSSRPVPETAELPPVKVVQEQPSKPNLPDGGIPELPMGTWLGFHDIDPPLLAKLAMHDKVRRLLIFVNRKGIELRRLQEDEYLELLQQGEVDILETSSNFREQVERARQRMARHQPGGN